MLESLQRFALPACWEQGMNHWAVVPEGDIQPSNKPVETEQNLMRTIGEYAQRVSGNIFPSLANANAPQEQKQPDENDLEDLKCELKTKYRISLKVLDKLVTELEKEEEIEWTPQDLSKKVLSAIGEAEVALDGALRFVQHAVGGELGEVAWEARKQNDTETVTYNNTKIKFIYSELCHESPREGWLNAYYNAKQPIEQGKMTQEQLARKVAEQKNTYEAYRSFHLSRAVWSIHATDMKWQWLVIIGINAVRWYRLSTLLVAVSATVSFMRAKNKFTDNIRKSQWFGVELKPVFALSDQASELVERAGKALYSHEDALTILAGGMALHAGYPGLLGLVPFVSIGSFGGMLMTSLVLGDFIGADGPRRSVPLPEKKAQPEEEE